jgi:hypothetical protein
MTEHKTHRDNHYYSVQWKTWIGQTINGWKVDHDRGSMQSANEQDIISDIDNRLDNVTTIREIEQSNLKAMKEYYGK